MKRNGTLKKSLSAVAVGKQQYQHMYLVKVCGMKHKKSPHAHGKGACAGEECGFQQVRGLQKNKKIKFEINNFWGGRGTPRET